MSALYQDDNYVGVVVGELQSAVVETKYRAMVKFKPILERLESTLTSIESVIKEIEQYDRQLDQPKEEIDKFIEEMEGGRVLVLKCSKLKWWEYYFKPHYREKLEALDELLRKFFHLDMQLMQAQKVLLESGHHHMDPYMSKAIASTKRETQGTTGPSSLLLPDKEFPYKELLNLILTRDYMSLLLTYPVKLADDESMLKAWLNDVLQWTAQLSTGMMTTGEYGLLREQSRLLIKKLMRYMEGLVPMEILWEIEYGGRFMFKYNNNLVPTPEAILDLSVDLAVGQLIQTLLSGDDYVRRIHYVRLSTRNSVERRAVMEKMEAALKDKNMVGIDKSFLGAIQIDASIYDSDVEIHVQEEIAQHLKHMMMTTRAENEGDDVLCIEEDMVRKRYLVLLVDGDSNKKLDPRKVCFPGTKVTGIIVLITTETSSEYQRSDEDELTQALDLNIRTQDHLLPWQVLCNCAGSSIVRSSSAIQRIAVQIVEECHGHLFAIVFVAKSLKNVEDVKLWELALHKLHNMNPSLDYQESDRIGISRVMVNAFINIIWEGIDRRQKLCLEHSLFVPNINEGVSREILISDWVSIELAHTKEEAEHDISELLNSSVLLQCESSYIRLPKETYDILKLLHSLNPSFMRHGTLGLMEPPHIGRWHDLIGIELMDNKLSELPESPNCPKLEVLLLQGNIDLTEIPDSFFDQMPLLRYLDLSYTSIRVLPPSMSNLKELKKFHLRGCELFMELSPEIGQLKNLEKLDLEGTLITHLPKVVRELTNLQSLTLCFYGYHHKLGSSKKVKQYSQSTIIPRGVISNLTHLNYLSINVSPEDERWDENLALILPEILVLERLETVSIFFPTVDLLKTMRFLMSLDFRLVVGHHMHRFISRAPLSVEEKFRESDRSLKFVNGVDVPNAVTMVLGHSRALYLDRHMTIKSLSEFQLKNLAMLQVCILVECNEMETIVDGSFSYEGYPLSYLEYLSVFYMKNLRSIYEGPPLPSFLHSLRSVALHTCPMLTTIFTLDFLDNLSFLEELIVEDCPKVTTLISHNSSEQETRFFLPRLRIISLLYLPELVSVSNGLNIGQNLIKLGIFCCPKLQTLSKTEVSSKSLRVIVGESTWWETLKWKEAEQGEAGLANSLKLIFSPINEEANILTQLVANENENQQVEPKNEIEEGAKEDHSPAAFIFKDHMYSGETYVGNVEAIKVQEMPDEKTKTARGRWSWLPLSLRPQPKKDDIAYKIRYSYQELKKATIGFKDTALIDQRGSCKVYKGTLTSSRREVAVMRFSHKSYVDLSESEIASIVRLCHPNLVQLLGWCRHRGELLLVYEFMANGSLDKYLFDEPKTILSWEKRFNIIRGVASALVYLHEDFEQVVVHRDVKPGSVLLDGDLNARLGDFELAVLYEHGDYPKPTTIAGTLGYLAPEYVMTGETTTSLDIFSFGVFLLEVACGRRIFIFMQQSSSPERSRLVDWVWDRYQEGRIFDVVDPKLRGNFDENKVLVVLKLGLMCSNDVPSDRPSMREVVDYLDGFELLPDDLIRKPGAKEIGYQERFDEDLRSTPASTYYGSD